MTYSLAEGRVWRGRCVGGPLDGQDVTIDKPLGFLLAEKIAERGWFYDSRDFSDTSDGTFVVRAEEPIPVTRDDLIALSVGTDFDVIASPLDPPPGPYPIPAAGANPNPARITAELWRLWGQFDVLEPSALLGGIYAAKAGYHNYRTALPASDYSRRDVPGDRQGPGDKASAIDLTMSTSAMKKYTSRLDVAARARDQRLYISGVPVIREFIGTRNGSSVYCYVLTGGRPLGVGADAGPDSGRDSSHLWHLHLSIIRRFVNVWDAMDRLMSVLRGESLQAWRTRRNPISAESPESEDDDMSQQVISLPNGFAYDEAGDILAAEYVRTVLVEPAGFSGNSVFRGKRLYLSAGTDHTGTGSVKLRVAIHDGRGWTISIHNVSAGGRVGLPTPTAQNGNAFNISVGRMKTHVDAGPAESNLPLSVLVTVA